MRAKRIIAPALLVILVAAVLVQLPVAVAERAEGTSFIDPIIDARRILLDEFVSAPDEKSMRTDALRAMVAALDDPYTLYVPPDLKRDFEKELSGTYVGIGAEVNIIDDYLVIITPLEDSPALEAGIRAGDVVLEIDGTSTHQLDVDDCIDLLLGEPGSLVTILVRHADGAEEKIQVERRQIVTKTVRGLKRRGPLWDYCLDDELGLFYVRVTQFNNSTGEELRQTMNQLQSQGLNGLIMDLRDDPGGALHAAVEVADLFLSNGTIVTIRGRNDTNEQSSYARAEGTLPDFPMVVIVNGRSASASEIVAGALQDHKRAKVLGNRTYGKGSVQHVRQLPFNNGTLKYTAAHYYLPSGRNLNRGKDSIVWGVDPDPGLVVPMNDDLYIQMLTARRDFEVIEEPNDKISKCADPEWIRSNILDEQLAAALEAMQNRMRTGEWPVIGNADPAQLELSEELQRLTERRAAYLEQVKVIEQRTAELQKLAETAGRVPLLPDDVQLIGGTMILRDRHGNEIGRFEIEGGNVELALETLRLNALPPGD